MPIRVLIVEDSGFFRRRLSEIIGSDPRLEVVGMAENGLIGVRKVSELQPDVITMDIEMPEMDGITAVRRIMAVRPTPILMLSTLTHDGAKATLDALEAGASDFLPKRFEDISSDREEAKNRLRDRICALGRRSTSMLQSRAPVASSYSPTSDAASVPVAHGVTSGGQKKQLIAIGTSTGGPVALQRVLTTLPADFPIPILIIQHMPASFTPAFAQRLDQLCNINVKEATDGDLLLPGTALLAPGGKQMLVSRIGGRAGVHIVESAPENHYRPCVDVTLDSIAELYPADTLAIILTGMGADGREGVRKLKGLGSTIWAQDEASSIIYGMPQAIAEAGLADKIVALDDVGPSMVASI